MLAWVVIIRQHRRQTPPSFFPWVPFPFWSHPSLIPEKLTPFFSCTYVEPILQPPCFQIHACNGGRVYPHSPTCQPSNLPPCFRAIPFLFKLLRTLLRSRETQLFSFQSFPHSLRKTTRGGGCLWLTSSLLGSTFQRSNVPTFKLFNVFSLPRFSPSRRTVALPQHGTARPLCSAPPGRTIEVHAGAKLASRPWPPRALGH